MIYGSVCSGIEAATVAWDPLGWKPAFLSEIEKFPSQVLQHYYPSVPNHGDMTKFQEWPDHAIELLVGGTPCQSFSVAGLRKGLDDPRGNLMLTYLAIARRYKPKWLVWENVPGVLSSNGGRDFGTFIRGLEECGYHAAWRVLDAQYFRVAQRRRRVFVVGYLGDWRRAAAVLFERESLRGNTPPSRETGKGITYPVAPSLTASGRGVERTGESRGQDPLVAVYDRQSSAEYGTQDIASTVSARDYKSPSDLIAFGWHNSASQGDSVSEHISPSLDKSKTPAVSIQGTLIGRNEKSGPQGAGVANEISFTLTKTDQHAVNKGSAVRRLTPVECERLQGFPDNYTNIPYRGKQAADGPRYKALGNSMAVPCMRWIGERIAMVDALK